ncbi:sugar-transfer associated ATP-grasp domain-containing protein [Halalkalicoccus subterraneus]|uniref:sugar-transfer associated ATP-grasp domain-containing protein n=1 Tax=Halalkalicoccus subterraneus TaxID=2675002 RepID=UPI000EFB54E6|nr:sugar-transfer associated ATP-grasp domain-containing protein [Halalkalicoccus subterraneus]
MVTSLKELYHTLRQVQSLVAAEREGFDLASLSPAERVDLWRRGFLSPSAALYEFERYGYDDYLTDYQRYVKTRGINGRFGYALDNKLLTYDALSGFPEHLPALHGLVENGRLRSVSIRGERGPTRPVVEWVADRPVGETVVLKWVLGGGGHNVFVLTRTDGGYRLNGEDVSRAALEDRLGELDEYVVTGFSEQAAYADGIYPEATNSVRAVTMWDPATDEPFLARAVHRIGTDETKPMDNWTQGGISAPIDEDGVLGRGAHYLAEGDLERRETHPDTGARIAGAAVPGWGAVREELLAVADSVPHLPYVGWDLVVTEDGEFEVIEANNYPGVKSLQVHGPLCADERVERFYRAHGVR